MLKYNINITESLTDDNVMKPVVYKTENISFIDNGDEIFAKGMFSMKRLYYVTKRSDKIKIGDNLNFIHSLSVNNNIGITNDDDIKFDAVEKYEEYIKLIENKKIGNDDSIVLYTTNRSLKIKNIIDNDDIIKNVFNGFNYDIVDNMMIVCDIERFQSLNINKIYPSYLNGKINENHYSLVCRTPHFFRVFDGNSENDKNIDKKINDCLYVYVRYNALVKYENLEDFGKAIVYVKIPVTYSTKNVLELNIENVDYYTEYGSVVEEVEENYKIKTILDNISGLRQNTEVLTSIDVLRETPYFFYKLNNGYITQKLDKFIAFSRTPLKKLSIPLSSNCGLNVLQNDIINGYVENVKEKSINRINEMEKDVYFPVIKNGKTFKKVNKIKFNLHLREHKGSDWVVEPTAYWNGTYAIPYVNNKGEEKVKLVLMDKDYINNCKTLTTNEKNLLLNKLIKFNNCNYFTTYDKYNGISKVKNYSKHSDLISKLGFMDDDIRYRKQRLKKTFLRLSFYDSMNQSDQNLLCYSTVFIDTGKLFGKFIKFGAFDKKESNIFDGDYSSLSEKNKIENNSLIEGDWNLSGIRSNREFEYVVEGKSDGTNFLVKDETNNENVKVKLSEKRLFKDGNNFYRCVKNYKSSNLKLEAIKKTTDDIESENYRLSTQFVIENPLLSDNCGEGFNLYLWKDNDGGTVPSEIYMKVELNHAGYGRVIPFMMPYWDENKDNGKKGIKTFQDIIDDWSDDENKTEDTKYGIRKYLRYSYIRFKYCYDSLNDRHVYYMDDEVYGNDVNFSDDEIVINLYEAKIN